MKNWNTTAKIKTAILAMVGLINLFIPFKSFEQGDILSAFIFPIIAAIVLPSLMALIRAKAYKNINKAKWNDNPLISSMAMTEFLAYLFIVVGTCMVIGSLIKFEMLNSFGLISLSFGIGIFFRILLVDFISRKKSQ